MYPQFSFMVVTIDSLDSLEHWIRNTEPLPLEEEHSFLWASVEHVVFCVFLFKDTLFNIHQLINIELSTVVHTWMGLI